ncbi:helix-turn-helix domain-containing protein [Paracoccus sp. SY]|uniref:helix-turn-helix domain-containing protein n=1 Tax=Paracoccus sp. SY TaxID=1330255 RepID=UPI000CD02412|nr:helix-turn-helix domain-containing protein [Paracoccus sp. SY]
MIPYAVTSAGRRRSYIKLSSFRWAEGITCLPAGPKSLLLLLARRSDNYGCCDYTQEKLAEQLGCSKRSISNYIRVLRHFGLVRTIGRLKDFKRTSSVYHLVAWWPRELLPITGHPKYGRFVKEPSEDAQRQIQAAQKLLYEAEKFASQYKYSEVTEKGKDEEILEACLAALGNWANDADREMLRGAWNTLFELLEEGYSLQAHVLPVLRKKAASRHKPKQLRSWHYFAETIARYAARHPVHIEEAPEQRFTPAAVNTEDEQARKDLNQLYEEITGKGSAKADRGGSS